MENQSETTAVQKKRRRGGWDQPSEILPNPVIETNSANVVAAGAFQAPVFSQAIATPVQKISVPIAPSSEFLQLQAALAIQQKAKSTESCRIYVGALHYELSQENIRALFSAFGNITKLDLSREPGTTRSKGFCFIEYDNPASAEAAMALNGFELAGRNIKVGRPAGGPCGSSSVDAAVPNLTISSISFGMTAKEQAQALMKNVEPPALASPAASLLAAPFPTLVAPPPPTPAPAPPKPPLPSGPPPQPETVSQSASRTLLVRNIAPEITRDMLKIVFAPFGTVTECQMVSSSSEDTTTSTTGLQSATIQFQLSSSAKEAVKSLKDFSLAGHTLGVDLMPSPVGCTSDGDDDSKKLSTPAAVPALLSVVLENMVSVAEAGDPDLKDEIAEECSRHGPLDSNGVNIVVENGVVLITVTYVSEEHAKVAFKALNGRYFAGRKVKATLKAKSG